MTKEEIIDLRERGFTFADIGKRYGVTRQWVNYVYHREKGKASKKEQIREQAALLYKNGMPFYKIAEELHCDYRTVRAAIPNAKKMKLEMEKETAVFLLSQGYSYKKIAGLLGCSENKVRYLTQ